MKAKKIFPLAAMFVLLFVLLAATFTVSVSAANYTAAADDLNSLGLFIGTQRGYDLDREPTMAEAAVMLVRLLGDEAYAKENNFGHAFTDVPEWASPYVGYLYENKLLDGMDGGEFYPWEPCDAEVFCAFVLRALGYTEETGDFAYGEAVDFAYELGLASDDMYYYCYDLTRDGCVYVMYKALGAKIKGTDTTLLYWLVEKGAVGKEAAGKFMEKLALVDEFKGVLTSSVLATAKKAMGQPCSAELEVVLDRPAMEMDLGELVALIQSQGYTFEVMLVDMLEMAGYEIEDLPGLLERLKAPGSDSICKMIFSSVGGDVALEVYFDYLGMGNMSVYYTDGYLFADYAGEKIRQKVDLEDMGFNVPDMEDLEDITGGMFDLLPLTIGSIEKTVSGEGIAYKLTNTSDYGDIAIEASLSVGFAPGGEISSGNLALKLSFGEGETMPVLKDYYIDLQLDFKITFGGEVTIDFPDYVKQAKEELALLDELNELLKSGIPSKYSADFETIFDSDKTSGTVSVSGSNYAAEFTSESDGSISSVSEYRKNGYIYTEIDGKKIKSKYMMDSLVLSMVPVLEFVDYAEPIQADDVGGMKMEKIVSEEEIVYKIYLLADENESYYFHYDGILMFTFDLEGKLVSMYCDFKAFYGGELEASIYHTMKITATGKNVKIVFPDFSDYEEYADDYDDCDYYDCCVMPVGKSKIISVNW